MSDALLEVDALTVRYGGDAATRPLALDGVSFSVTRGAFVSIVGPSGSGKTTLLRCVAGLMRPTSGEIWLAGRAVTDVPRDLALVFQDYGRSLFPWLTVRDNVELPLRRQGLSRSERGTRVAAALAEVGLPDVHDRHPWQLSGGMQQRVAIARAVAYRPEVLLMDEPFGSVDAQTRADLQDMLLAVSRAHGSTVVFVTHDIDESIYLSDQVIVLSPPPGRVAAEIAVTLPRPRDQIETRAASAFVDLRAEVARLINRPPQRLPSAP